MKLLHLLRRLLSVVVFAVSAIYNAVLSLAGALFGQLDWQAPTWFCAMQRQLSALWRWAGENPKRTFVIVATLAALGAGGHYGWQWYKKLPQPHTVSYSVDAPAITDYNQTPVVIDTLDIRFDESAAPLENIKKTVTAGITLSPAIPGEWRWEDDRNLRFTPAQDWPIAQQYEIHLDKKKLLAAGTLLQQYTQAFTTTAFSANVESTEFYQDPVDVTLKKMIATIRFSHPVDEASVREHITLKPGEGLRYRDAADQKQQPYSVTFDEKKLNAFIHSVPLAIPLETTSLYLKVDKGLKSSLGGNNTEVPLETSISVDGRYRLSFNDIQMNFVNNAKDEPEQVILISSSHPVTDENIRDNVHAWILPERIDPETKEKAEYGWGYGDINEAILKQSAPVTLAHVPSIEPLNQQHAFRFKAQPGQQIYVRINAKIESVGGYIAKEPTADIIQVQEYPKTLHLLSHGSLLSLNGEKKLGFMARGVKDARIEIARILPEQLHHLVANNTGSIVQPKLSESQFDELVEREQISIPLPENTDGKTVYDNIDLGKYLNSNGGRKGIFVIRLTNAADDVNSTFDGYYRSYYDGYDSGYSEEGYEDNYNNENNSNQNTTSDLRFIVVTDLGLIVKKSLDGSQDVFVQSISTGEPVAGATVDVLGKNGLQAQTGTTDANGRVTFAKLGELKREKTPLMYVVSKGNDLAFLPINAQRQQLSFSRFDIGGLSNTTEASKLSAYLFTDRGLYRPGETAHMNMIVRTANWQGALAGLPVTLQITDPRGVSAQESTLALSASGFESVDFTSSEVAPAGEYLASLYLMKPKNERELLGSTKFMVRDFEPDRMKVSVSLSETASSGWVTPEQVKAVVQARHLFGAPASGRDVKASMRLDPILPSFNRYPDFRFYLSDNMKIGVQENLTETQTNDNGEATLDVDLKRFTNSTYRLSVLAQVFEAGGGRNVQADNNVLVSSAASLLGIKSQDSLSYITKGAERTLQLVAVNPALDSITVDNLSLNLYEYRYVSVLVKQRNGTFKFESRRKDVLIDSKPFAIAAGGQNLKLPTENPGDFAYVIKDTAGITLNQAEFTVAGSGNVTRSLERNAELQLRLSKKSYSPGEQVEINIRAPYTGSGLITIERDKVYAVQWFHASTVNSVQTITVPESLEGNAYINVQFVRDPSSSEIYMSPLSYGVAPFSIALDARKLDVKVEAPDTVIPGSTIDFKVSTSEPARVALFAVDEGILQVAGYKNPDPLAFFFQKRALEVSTIQILDLILPEFSQLMNAAAPGGDGDKALENKGNPFKRKRQQPAVYWSGLVDIPADGKTFHYTTPDSFNGKLRIIAVAVTPQRVGVFAGATEVRGPLILTPNIPAFIAPHDDVLITTGVFNNLPTQASITVELKTSAGLQMAGENRSSVTLDVAPQKEGTATFLLQGTEALGSADLWFVATANDTTVKLQDTTSVRPAVPYRTQLTVGRSDKSSTEIPTTRDLFDPFRQVEFGAGFSPIVWMRGMENYLEHYMYGCTEQLVSKALPALVFTPHDVLVAGKSPAIDKAISILMERQNAQGGFGLWSANPIVSPIVSSYATDFLLEAKERGYPVPRNVLEHASAYLEYYSNQPSNGLTNMRARAYAAYLLTRSGKLTTRTLADITTQLNAYHSKEWKTDITAAYIAASYALLKQDDIAQKLIADVPWRELGKEQGYYSVYYDALVHDTTLLTLISRHFPAQTKKVPAALLDKFGERISRNEYHSLSAANMIRGMDLYDAQVAANGDIKVRAQLKDKQNVLLAMLSKPPRAEVPQGTVAVELEKVNGAHAYYLMSESGFDRNVPDTELKQGIEVVSEYQDLDGKPLASPAQVKVGEEFLVQLRVRAMERNSVEQIALIALLPGGVEPVVQRAAVVDPAQSNEETSYEGESSEAESTETSNTQWQSPAGDYSRSTWYPEFVDVRDDRLVLYGTISRDAQTFVFRVRAINAGKFQGPPPYAEAMYEPTLQARGKGSKLEIVQP